MKCTIFELLEIAQKNHGIIMNLVNKTKCKVILLQEDFQPLTYGFKMAADVTDVRAVGMMKEVEDDLNRAARVNIVQFCY